ncbi:MAG TPA: LamG-like jellyroll fold domain-containing protein [Verrucomicrobiae bacterium]|nr:LamG-like jellyroll fold domain-containing protein [Verrucomicrobiae bacterium]
MFSGAGLVGTVIVLVAARLLGLQMLRPAHFKEITNAYGADSLFFGTPQVNHAGNRFTVVKTDAIGYGLFLCDTDTGRAQILCDEDGLYKDHDSPDINALPWAPDDKSFLYTLSNKLVICSAETHESFGELPVDTNSITAVAWLTPLRFAYVSHQTNLWEVQKQANGQWERRVVCNRMSPLSSLTMVSDDTVAWLEDNLLCKANVLGEAPKKNNDGAVTSVVDTTAPFTNSLKLWLDTSTLKLPDQSAVTHLSDLSPSKNDALENGNPPVYNGPNNTHALNGKGTLHFSSAESITNAMGLATRSAVPISGASPRTVFVVMRHDNSRKSMMVSMGEPRVKGSLFSIELTNSLYLPTGWKGADNRIKFSSTSWNIFTAMYDGIAESGYVNGSLRGTTQNRLNTAEKTVQVGLRTAGPDGKNAKGADGDFAELLIYDRALNSEERRRVEDYLGMKWFGQVSQSSGPDAFVWFDPGVTGLTNFNYSKDTGQFTLCRSDGKHSTVSRFDPNGDHISNIFSGGVFLGLQTLSDQGYAYWTRDLKKGHVVFTDASGKESSRLLQGSDLRWFQCLPDGKKLLVLGTVFNEPSAGVWEYDLASKKLSAVVPYSDYPSPFAKNISSFDKVIPSPSKGTNLTCAVFRPANFNPHRKYPLVIGDTRFIVALNGVHGRQWVPCVAAGGAYVVIVERRGWWIGIDDWGKDVLTAYDALKQDLNIDTSQVFLFGSSAETQHMGELMTKSPQLWKGVILLNPAGVPEWNGAPFFQSRPKILISAGTDENNENELKRYQQEALTHGVQVEYVLHAGEGHHLVGNVAQLERTRAIMNFIFKQ